MADIDRQTIRASFVEPRYEIIPMKGVEQQLAYLPDNAIVTVTSSPTKGMDATLALTTLLRRRAHTRVVPHIAARLIGDNVHLKDLLQQLTELGIEEVFVVAGDAETPVGTFEGTVQLLRAMADIGHSMRVGITGYPESHAFIPDDTTVRVMHEKEPYATHIVSQICYDPAVTARWIAAVRARGTHLPIYVGLPGAIDLPKLLRISMRVGIGDSVRYLRKQGGTVARLVGGYRPDALVENLAATVADPEMRVAGWHLFTFNEIRRTEAWRQDLLTRYARTSP
ncbi:MAG: methylenetetrahydrofolate reductase [Actinobacteria bacterium]|nr:methylenetetrahydrofolate reductase [Actinomycetota bacterium]